MDSLEKERHVQQSTTEPKKRLGLAFQGGSFLAGAVDTGVVRALLGEGVFDEYDVCAFTGTSAGALVAAVCWSLTLEGRIDDAAEVLRKQWLHNANGIIPNEAWGNVAKGIDKVARFSPFYDFAAQKFITPWLRASFKVWVETYIDSEAAVGELYKLKKQFDQQDTERTGKTFEKDPSVPHLVLGSADVLEGKVVSFVDKHLIEEVERYLLLHPGKEAEAVRAGAELMVQHLMASGSLDEINGMTTIEEGPHKGTYLDGAWGQNPPINELIDLGVDEILVVEIFPKFRAQIPMEYGQREDRKEELWQNSLVEHELHSIDKVNEWLRNGRLLSDYRQYALCYSLPFIEESDALSNKENKTAAFEKRKQELGAQGIDVMAPGEFKPYRHIEIRRMPMTLDFTPGARIVNSASFLRDKMDYGYENCRHYLSRIGHI